MRVKLKTSVAGHNWSGAPGEVVDMTDADAKRYIERGYATAAKGQPADEAEDETATAGKKR